MERVLNLINPENPLRVAIIGAGPAAFYAAEALFKQQAVVCQVDMFNRFPTPFGLVREGVAPDHESIKTVTRVYDKTAQHPAFRYFGNVTFGQDIFLEDLKTLYDAVIVAVGAQSDRRMHIMGEDLRGSFPATVFVGWYNGHPDYADLEFDLSQERVVVVGNGNVAMDVARILVTSPEELAKTDIADYALQALRRSKVREVVLLGRRGPVQAAFTNPELKEFGELAGVDVIVDPAELVLDEASEASLMHDKTAAKNLATLRTYAQPTKHQQPRRIVMRFLVSPVEILGEQGQVRAVKLEKNRLEVGEDGNMRACSTGQSEVLPTGLIFRSVGYRGVPLPGLPFNEGRGIIPNKSGRIFDPASGEILPGLYVVGWAKRGPSGIIGTNKPDSAATVECLIEDFMSGAMLAHSKSRDSQTIEKLLESRGIRWITYEDWQQLNNHEIEQGRLQGRPRVKVYQVNQMLEIIEASKLTSY
jgi:ferredoxin--NADP+ reductase